MNHRLELLVELARAIRQVATDVDLSSAEGFGHEFWPEDIVGSMEQLQAMKIVMKRAVKLMPEHRAELLGLYKREYASAHWERDFPMPPLLPETVAEVDAAWEAIQRERLFDPELDLRVR